MAYINVENFERGFIVLLIYQLYFLCDDIVFILFCQSVFHNGNYIIIFLKFGKTL